MAEMILGVLCLLAGAVFALLTLLVLLANDIGRATNAAAVNIRPALWSAIFAVAGFTGGLSLIL